MNADAVRETVSLLGLDPSPFEWILKRKTEKGPSQMDNEAGKGFAAYLTEIERVILTVDQLERD